MQVHRFAPSAVQLTTMIEADPNPFPEIPLFPRLERAGKFISNVFSHITDPGLSEHFNHGGGPALDRALYDDIQTHGFVYDERDVVFHSTMGDTTIDRHQ